MCHFWIGMSPAHTLRTWIRCVHFLHFVSRLTDSLMPVDSMQLFTTFEMLARFGAVTGFLCPALHNGHFALMIACAKRTCKTCHLLKGLFVLLIHIRFSKGSSERGAEPAKNAYTVRLMIKMFVTENLGRILPMTACVKKHDIIPQDVCIYRYIYIPY
jgi:hypothetical protein